MALTKKDAHGRCAAIVAGTKAEAVRKALGNIPQEEQDLAEKITVELSSSTKNITIMEFPNCKRTSDRSHVQKLALEAIREMGIAHRWEALWDEHERKLWVNATGEVIPPEVFANEHIDYLRDTKHPLPSRAGRPQGAHTPSLPYRP